MGIRRLAALALLALLVACAEPLPPARTAYAGQWFADKMRLEITTDGYVSYERRSEHGKTTINAPIQEFVGDDFTVGFGPFRTRFVVSKPPRLDGGVWKMTVDGVEMVRRSGSSEYNA